MIARGVLSLLGLAALSGTALAGDYGCAGNCFREAVLPPVYGTVAERVTLRQPYTRDVVVPGEYATVRETVEVGPRRVWQVKHDAWGHKVGCWVEVEPHLQTRERTVTVSAPASVPVTTYATYGTREHTVMLEPARKTWVPFHGGAHYGEPPIRANY